MSRRLPPHLIELAKEAGFCFWEDEEYGPGPGYIDWSNDYTSDLERFAQLVVERCAEIAEDAGLRHAEEDGDRAAGKKLGAFEVAREIREAFEGEDE